jgi:hypothetical protein
VKWGGGGVRAKPITKLGNILPCWGGRVWEEILLGGGISWIELRKELIISKIEFQKKIVVSVI